MYAFQFKDVSVNITADYVFDNRIMWWGPPVVPFIPKFLYAHEDVSVPRRLAITLTLESTATRAILDLAEIQARSGNGDTLQIEPVHMLYDSKAVKEIPKRLAVAAGKIRLDLECKAMKSELEQFTLSINGLTVGEEKINLPPLTFTTGSTYRYEPLIISNGLGDTIL